MRFFSLVSLTTILLLILSPAVFAAKVTDPEIIDRRCFNGTIDSPEAADLKENEIATQSGTACANPDNLNPASNQFEKADCTQNDLVITELIEPLTPSFSLTENEKVIDVYKGICCMYTEDAIQFSNDVPEGAEALPPEETPAEPEAYNGEILLASDDDDAAAEAPADTTTESPTTTAEALPQYCAKTRSVYMPTFTECNQIAAHCEKRQWLISGTGGGVIRLFVKQAYIFGAGTAGFVAVVVIVISGIQISVSGVSGDITSAKDRIVQSIAGLVLLFLSGIILYTINPTFFT
ncbi:pilin [Patescibacteria group bacterium]|nr:pilin [Patescibacteria group bacterium]